MEALDNNLENLLNSQEEKKFSLKFESTTLLISLFANNVRYFNLGDIKLP